MKSKKTKEQTPAELFAARFPFPLSAGIDANTKHLVLEMQQAHTRIVSRGHPQGHE